MREEKNADPNGTARHAEASRPGGAIMTQPLSSCALASLIDFIPSMVSPAGVIAGPAGDRRLGAVLREDLARAAVGVLTGEGHDGMTYAITGRESFTLAEAAERMSRLTGKHITYHHETLEEA
jgi:uncharacterized protein YbjT (DUF2867 family)